MFHHQSPFCGTANLFQIHFQQALQLVLLLCYPAFARHPCWLLSSRLHVLFLCCRKKRTPKSGIPNAFVTIAAAGKRSPAACFAEAFYSNVCAGTAAQVLRTFTSNILIGE